MKRSLSYLGVPIVEVAEIRRGDRAQAGTTGMNPHLQGLIISGLVLVVLLVVLLFVMGCAVPLR